MARLFDALFLQEGQRIAIVHLLLLLDQLCRNKGPSLGDGCSWVVLLQSSTAHSLLYKHLVPTYSTLTLPVASRQLTAQLQEACILF